MRCAIVRSMKLLFTCGGCGRDGFEVVSCDPPILIVIYDKDNEGETCLSCPKCDTYFPIFAPSRLPEYYRY
jgi:hypothetical protein